MPPHNSPEFAPYYVCSLFIIPELYHLKIAYLYLLLMEQKLFKDKMFV